MQCLVNVHSHVILVPGSQNLGRRCTACQRVPAAIDDYYVAGFHRYESRRSVSGVRDGRDYPLVLGVFANRVQHL
jgi:hypothetical protein